MADDNEIEVRVTADASGVKDGMDEAKADVADGSEGMGASLEELANKFAEAFAVEKIAEFVKESLGEFAKLQRQLDVLGIQVQNHGGDWGKMKEGVEAFLESEESVYGFSKTELAQALNDMEIKTGNVTASMKLLTDAEKLSTLTGQSLQTTSEALALAYEGNSRGLMELGRLLGLTKDQSKDAATVFSELEKRTQGISTALNDTQGHINQLSAAWDSFKEFIGAQVAPVFDFLSKTMAQGIKVEESWILVLKAAYEATAFHFDALKTLGNDIKKVWDGQADAIKSLMLESDKQAAKEADNNQKRAKMSADLANEQIKDSKKVTTTQNKSIDDIKAGWVAYYSSIGDRTSQFTADVIASAKSGADAWKTASEDMLQNVKDSLAAQLQGWADSWFAKAAGFAAAGNFASAGLDAAAGAAIEAAIGGIQALASGGIVTQPTLALVGEAGPEAVVPLDKAGGGMTGLNFGDVHMHFPGITRSQDFDSGVHRNAARQLLSTTDDMNRRRGSRIY